VKALTHKAFGNHENCGNETRFFQVLLWEMLWIKLKSCMVWFNVKTKALQHIYTHSKFVDLYRYMNLILNQHIDPKLMFVI